MGEVSSERRVVSLNLCALAIFFLLHLLFLQVSYPRLSLEGERLGEYVVALLLSLLCLVLAGRAQLAMALCLMGIDLLALHLKAATSVRWAFAWCAVLILYLALRSYRSQHTRFNTAVLCLAVLVLLAHVPLVATELVLRYMMASTDPAHLPCLGMTNTLWKNAQLYDSEINSQGLRERELDEFKPQRSFRIFFDGDSVTFGLGDKIEETLPRQVEALANQTEAGKNGLHYQCINGGWPAWNTYDEFLQLQKKGGFYEPDVVVLVWFPNDIELGNIVYPMPGLGPYLDPLYENWLGYTFWELRLSNVLQQLGLKETYLNFLQRHFQTASDYAIMKGVFYNMNVWCRHYHRRFMVVLYPFMETLNNYQLKSVHDQVHQTLDEFNIPCLDLLPHFAGRDERQLQVYPHFNHHPNGAAQAIAAKALVDFMTQRGLIRP